jgi:hypothetical protein
MGHEVVRVGAVPMLFVSGCADDVARVQRDDFVALLLDESEAIDDKQGLTESMRVPSGVSPGAEPDDIDSSTRRFFADVDGVQPYVAGERLRGTFPTGGLGVDLHCWFLLVMRVSQVWWA